MSSATKSLGFSNNVQVISWNNLPACTVVAHLWGGGGGAGGADAKIRGGAGGGGGYSQVTFEISGTDDLVIAVGGGGGGGRGNTNTNSPGGAAGPSLTNSAVYNTTQLVGGSIVRRSNPNYVSFLNSNGVWYNYNASVFDETRTVNFAFPGTYTFSLSCDNYGEMYLDGILVVATPSPRGFESVSTATLSVTAGLHTIRVRGVDLGAPASIAATVSGDFSYSGGTGGKAGASGSSGAGGGGGGATVLSRNFELMAVAGGGGGGGGAGVRGLQSNTDAPGNRGANAGFSAGMNGQDKSGDGGGGGGGGGGYTVGGAGRGGQQNSGDVSGGAGFYGANYAPTWLVPGTSINPAGSNPGFIGTPRPGSAGQGATSSGANGTGGACVLEFRFNGTRIKDSLGSSSVLWRSAQNIWIKRNGTWQSIQTSWVKNNGDWVVILASDNTVPNSFPYPGGGLFGVNPQPYS
jgi:hypothetical protein